MAYGFFFLPHPQRVGLQNVFFIEINAAARNCNKKNRCRNLRCSSHHSAQNSAQSLILFRLDEIIATQNQMKTEIANIQKTIHSLKAPIGVEFKRSEIVVNQKQNKNRNQI